MKKYSVACILLLTLCVQPVSAFFSPQRGIPPVVTATVLEHTMPNCSLLLGRVYDPQLGRFLSADTAVQFPQSLQSYNRYSYVQNNPLSFTDPTGWVLTPAMDAFGSNRGMIRDSISPQQQHARASGVGAAPFTFLVNMGSQMTQAAVLSSKGADMPVTPQMLEMAQAIKADTQSYLAESRDAIMKADGVGSKYAADWSEGNGNGERVIAVLLAVAPLLKEIPSPGIAAEETVTQEAKTLAGSQAADARLALSPKARAMPEVPEQAPLQQQPLQQHAQSSSIGQSADAVVNPNRPGNYADNRP